MLVDELDRTTLKYLSRREFTSCPLTFLGFEIIVARVIVKSGLKDIDSFWIQALYR